eukprot:Skav210992  [mRNA]  locus=scaffold2325:30524:39491:+ [translate_table: standard]
MSHNALLLELQALSALNSRVLALELASGTSSAAAPSVAVTYNTVVDVPPSPVVNSSAESSSRGPQVVVGAERRLIALEVGAFLRRCLDGLPRGVSGRDRVPLASRLYVLCRDLSGQLYNPVRVFKQFAQIKPLVKEGNNTCGDSVFIGFPTQWEAKGDRKGPVFRKDRDGNIRRYGHRKEGAGNLSPPNRIQKKEKADPEDHQLVKATGYKKNPKGRKYYGFVPPDQDQMPVVKSHQRSSLLALSVTNRHH